MCERYSTRPTACRPTRQTRDGYLWVGSYGGLLRFDGSEFHNFSTEGAIATPSIRCLFEDSAGRL